MRMSDDRNVWNTREAAGFHTALKFITVYYNDKIEKLYFYTIGKVLGICLYIHLTLDSCRNLCTLTTRHVCAPFAYSNCVFGVEYAQI